MDEGKCAAPIGERRRKKRAVNHSMVLTSSPYKESLVQNKKNKKMIPTRLPLAKSGTGKNSVKALGAEDGAKTAGKAPAKKKDSLGSVNVRDTTPWDTCSERFCDDTSGRKWIQCQICLKWFHNECQGLFEKDRPSKFICVLCEDADDD